MSSCLPDFLLRPRCLWRQQSRPAQGRQGFLSGRSAPVLGRSNAQRARRFNFQNTSEKNVFQLLRAMHISDAGFPDRIAAPGDERAPYRPDHELSQLAALRQTLPHRNYQPPLPVHALRFETNRAPKNRQTPGSLFSGTPPPSPGRGIVRRSRPSRCEISRGKPSACARSCRWREPGRRIRRRTPPVRPRQ